MRNSSHLWVFSVEFGPAVHFVYSALLSGPHNVLNFTLQYNSISRELPSYSFGIGSYLRRIDLFFLDLHLVVTHARVDAVVDPVDRSLSIRTRT